MNIFTRHPRFTWTHLSGPTHEQITEIIAHYNVHSIIEEDLLNDSTQDKVDAYDDYIFLVLHFPKYDTVYNKYYTNEFTLILGKNFLVSIATHPTKRMDELVSMYDEFVSSKKHHDDIMYTAPYWAYRILDAMYDKTITTLGKFVKDMHVIEEHLFLGKRLKPKLLGDLLIKRRNSIYLKHLIRPHQDVLEDLQKAVNQFYEEQFDVYYEDLQYKFTKVEHSISTVSENTDSLANTYNSLANVETNTVISTLTVLTVMIGLMTLITGLYGMNVDLPGQGDPRIFLLIVGVMLVIGLLGLIFSKRRGWR